MKELKTKTKNETEVGERVFTFKYASLLTLCEKTLNGKGRRRRKKSLRWHRFEKGETGGTEATGLKAYLYHESRAPNNHRTL